MLLNPDAVGIAIEILREKAEDVFYDAANRAVYQGMVSLFRQGKPVDAVTLVTQLSHEGVLEKAGGASYIAELAGAVPTSANLEYYASIVLDAAMLRHIINTCTNLAAEAYNSPEDVSALLDRAEGDIFSIAEARQLNPIYKVSDLLEDSIRRIEEIMKSRSGITGLPTGFHHLDEMLSGLQPSDMVVLAARPSVGKTAFALNIASHLAVAHERSVLLFSLEMSKEQLTQRLLCMEGQIDSRRLRTGFLARAEFPKLQKAADRLSRAPLYIDDTPNISILDLRSKARRHKAQHGVDVIVIDYLQLMSSPGRTESRQVEIAEISRSVKGIARELQAPVVSLSQLSREAERDDSGMPKLSHLRESGAIEQDADVVLMLSRPPAHEAEGNDNLIRVTVAKQRNGPTGHFDLLFDRAVQKFKNLSQGGEAVVEEQPPPAAEYDEEPLDEPYEGYAAEFPEEEDDVPF
jgi:replicative DNA helicase